MFCETNGSSHGSPGFLDPPAKLKKWKDLLDYPVEWVNLNLLPDINAESLKNEPEFSQGGYWLALCPTAFRNASDADALRHRW